jgi:ribosomal protein S18 acetylase RimI-like enzyme
LQVAPDFHSFVAALRGALAERGEEPPVADVFGLTGFAFRLVVSPRVDLSGWAAFPWAQELPAAVGRLGWRAELVHADEGHPLRGVLHARALELCRQSAIAWGVHVPAFGLARLDGAELRISGALDGRGGAQTMPAAALGGGDVPQLFALALIEKHSMDTEAARTDALREALRLAFEPMAPAGYAAGLTAFDAWIAALESGHVDPAGHAYTAQLLAEARRHAATFTGIEDYGRVAAAASELAERFPFPPQRPLDNAALEGAAQLLRRAREAELRALAGVEKSLVARLRDASADRYSIEDAAPADLYGCLVDLPVGGLEPAARDCVREVGPRLGRDFFAKVARDRQTDAVVGHVYWAPLEASRYAIAAEGKQAFLFCPWVKAELRGRGIGKRLFAALRADAEARGFDGILTEATTLPIFLHADVYAGFRELAREGEMRLLYLPIRSEHPVARWLPAPAGGGAPASSARRGGGLPPPAEEDLSDRIDVRHAYNCPLLYATRRAAAEAARAERLPVDERDADGAEAGIVTRGRRLPNLPAAPDVLLEALRRR